MRDSVWMMIVPYLPYLASSLAVTLSLLTLYFQRRDREPRLGIRVRYEYRAGGEAGSAFHQDTQEDLYLRLGEFLRENGLAYSRVAASGAPMVRFAITNRSEKPIRLMDMRLVLRDQKKGSGEVVLDPREGRTRQAALGGDETGNLLSEPVRLRVSESVGKRLELARLSNILISEGFDGEVRVLLVVGDQSGKTHRKPFLVNTDLWGSSRR